MLGSIFESGNLLTSLTNTDFCFCRRVILPGVQHFCTSLSTKSETGLCGSDNEQCDKGERLSLNKTFLKCTSVLRANVRVSGTTQAKYHTNSQSPPPLNNWYPLDSAGSYKLCPSSTKGHNMTVVKMIGTAALCD